MSDFITLTCPSCSAKLQITNDVERFACGNCGNEHIIRRNGGIVSIAPIVESLTEFKTSIDINNAEHAIKRLREDIPKLEAKKRDVNQKFQAAINIFDPNYITAKSKFMDSAKSIITGAIGGVCLLLLASYASYAVSINPKDYISEVSPSNIIAFFGFWGFTSLVGFISLVWSIIAWGRRQSLKGQFDQMENERLIKIETMKKEFQTEIGEIDREISSKQIELQRYEKMVSSR